MSHWGWSLQLAHGYLKFHARHPNTSSPPVCLPVYALEGMNGECESLHMTSEHTKEINLILWD